MPLTNTEHYVYGTTSFCPVERHEADEIATFHGSAIEKLSEERFAQTFDALVKRGVIDLDWHCAPCGSVHFGNS